MTNVRILHKEIKSDRNSTLYRVGGGGEGGELQQNFEKDALF